ncbi:MAG: hypothetical protein ACXVB0_01755 [Mucilaginibacter sp.]
MKKIFIILTAAMLASACKKENASPHIANTGNQVTNNLTDAADTSTVTPIPPNFLPAPPPQLDGTYTGVLETRFLLFNTGNANPKKVAVQINFSGNGFRSGDATNYDNVGSGVFNFLDSFDGSNGDLTKYGDIQFDNTDASLGNSTIQNPNARLLGAYVYEVKGDSLFLSQRHREISYQYKLKKY